MKDYLRRYLPEDEIDNFGEWAYGPDYKTSDRSAMMNSWNKLNGHHFVIRGNDQVSDSIKQMTDLYKKQKGIDV